MIEGLVSIAIPAYKCNFLAESIESALNQDYGNIELIIVNDKSPYDIDSVVGHYNDSRIRYYVNSKNLGKNNPVNNWNRCLELARGEFFVLLCDDDFLCPNFVSELLSLARRYPNCNVFHSRRLVRNEATGIVTESNEWPEWESLDSFYENKLKWIRIHTITEFMYRAEYVQRLKYISFPLAWGSDDISIINFAKEGGIASSKSCLAVFRVNEVQLSKNDTHMVQKAKARILNFYWVGEYFKGNPYDKEYMKHLSDLLIEFIKRASFIDKYRILLMAPKQSMGVKMKAKIAVNILRGRYVHPGHGCIGV